jgi:hypothetical protein
MTRNVGRLEWKLRAAAGIVLLAIALFIELPEAWEALPGVLGAIVLLTAIARYCPVNQLLGIRTRDPRR